MRRLAPRIITSVLVALLLLSGWKAARASVALVRAPHAGERTGLAAPRSTPVRARPASPLAEIARAERAIVFVYSPDCQVCHANMANWIDLVGELRGGPAVLYAVAPVQTPAARAYWGGLERHVRILTVTPQEVHAGFDVDNTPVTLLVRKGSVRGEIIGPLTTAARQQVRAFARAETLKPGIGKAR
jgi:hypothetical protein